MPETPVGGFPAAWATGCDALYSAERLDALKRTGLGADADQEMDRIAAWVKRALSVPTALVSLVQPDQQVFPGMVGMPEPVATSRATPLSHSFCQYVVAAARPLVISDARTDPLVADNLAIPDLGVIAYVGMPLTDENGQVLGSLCAIDGRPRDWRVEEIATLREIARSCSTELRLRLAQYDALLESGRRDREEDTRRRSHERSRMLLTASQDFTDTTTVQDVRDRIGDLLRSELHPVYAETVLRDAKGRLHNLPVGTETPTGTESGDVDPTAPATLTSSPRERTPSATAIRERRVVHYSDLASFAADHPPEVVAMIRDRGLHTVVAAPVPGRSEPDGAILLGWDRPDAVETSDLLTIATVAGYAGQALLRARVLEHHATVAHEMQDALLTVLPEVEGITMAARYAPADSRHNVGGDWYDAAPLADERGLAFSVGDIVGHDLPAITLMGQTRSMLRQAAWDHPGEGPAAILSAFELANRGLGLGAKGTAVVAQLSVDGRTGRMMRWSNAGHPPPILLHPDGRTESLVDHDSLFGFDLMLAEDRHDHVRRLVPGTTAFLYTDGLVERPGQDIDAGTDALVEVLDRARSGSPDEIVDAAMAMLPPAARDDAVAFAIRID
ncbi:GAF domain-containing SpoIIE family protein phosphatase [Pseudonocardia nematodicida]|uniref:GAF domain-containing SpoIIE family protein phosphatase n=1 Tax=Pseudonocardia nematodicida TaxID=1206997 RepID=A0ABV1KBD1_9PSEU